MSLGQRLPPGLAAALRPLVIAGRRRMAGRRRVNLAQGVACRLLGDPAWETFFGYYDISPFEPQGDRLLACRVARKRPGAMEIGYYPEAEEGAFTPASKTDSWCWQQGCRLTWAPALGRSQVLFNVLEKDGYAAATFDLDSGRETSRFVRPLYALAPGGRHGLSLNFARLQRLRPGYGYSQFADPGAESAAPSNDGIWLVDLLANDARLLHSLAEVAATEPQNSMAGAVHYFNHLAWNPSGSRFLFFHIWEHPGRRRSIRLLTSDVRGNLRVVTNERIVSHYCWIDDQSLLLFAEIDGAMGYFRVEDVTAGGAVARRCGALPERDGHPSWDAAAGRFVLDSLPDRVTERALMIYRPGDAGPHSLASFYSPPALVGEQRCDLHPRWQAGGQAIAVDTAHAGYRQMAIITPPSA